MAEQATAPQSEQAPSPAPEPMSVQQADAALESLFDSPSVDPDETETGTPADNADEPVVTPDDESERDDSNLTLPEDAENPETPESEDPASPEYANGQFVPDGGKVKMPDGRTISVAELKEFADNRAKEFQRDYSRKTEEHSKAVQEFETQRQEFSQQTERHSKEREFFTWFTGQYVPQEPQRPTVDANLDPVAWSVYAQQKATYDEMVNAWNAAQGAAQEASKAEAEKAQQTARQSLMAEREKFLAAFPSLKDQAKEKSFWDTLSTDANKFYGIPNESVPRLSDTTMVRILNDAVAYRRLRANSENVQKQVNTRPQLVQGSAQVRQTPQAQAMRVHSDRVQKLRQTGSNADAEAALLSFIK